jgi:cytochrome P450
MVVTTTLSGAPTFDLSFLDSGFNRDPYPVYEQIRALGPVVHNDTVPGYMLTGYRSCAKVLANVRRYRQPPEFFSNLFGDVVFEAIDTPKHDEIRGVWAEEFQRQTLQDKRRALVERVVEDVLVPFVDRVRSGETVDAVPELHRQIPLNVIGDMLGIDVSDRATLASWASAMPKMQEAMADPTTPRGAQLKAEAAEAVASLNGYFASEIPLRRKSPGDDLVSMMATAPVSENMTFGEVVANNTQLVFAGNETTARLMGHCLLVLAQHPDQRRAIAQDRSLIPQAIEEIHRFQTIAHIAAPRFVVDGDAEIDGTVVPEGARVVVLFGAANRDPDRWENPHEFDIFRERTQHLGFGFGMHSCLGLNLARLEVEVYLNRMLDLIPEWELADDANLGTYFYGRGSYLPVVAG